MPYCSSFETMSYTRTSSETVMRYWETIAICKMSPAYDVGRENLMVPMTGSMRWIKPSDPPVKAAASTEPSSENAKHPCSGLCVEEIEVMSTSETGFGNNTWARQLQLTKVSPSFPRTAIPSRVLVFGLQIRTVLSSPIVENEWELGSTTRSNILPAPPLSCGMLCGASILDTNSQVSAGLLH